MRAIMLAAATALVLSVQMAATARAEDTTIIRKDQPEDSTTQDSMTIVRKHDDINLFPIPNTEEHRTIIRKDRSDDDGDEE